MLFDIEPADVARLNQFQFTDLCSRLIEAEAAVLGVPAHQVRTSRLTTVADGAMDAIVFAVEPPGSRWLRVGTSVWQFKSGDVGPADVRKEFANAELQRVLGEAAAYVVCLAQDYVGRKLMGLQRAVEGAIRARGLPVEGRVLNASNIADWAHCFPSLLLTPYFARPVEAVMSFGRWAELPRFATPFVPDQPRTDIINDLAGRLSDADLTMCLRIVGPTGVGKTRLVLEALRESPLAPIVLYVESAEEALRTGLLSWIHSCDSGAVILVVDECSSTESQRVQERLHGSRGRVVLVTIGNAPPGARAGEAYVLGALGGTEMQQVVAQAQPGLPREQVRFVVRMASGYVKLAVAVAEAVRRDPMLSAHDVSYEEAVQRVLAALLGSRDGERALKCLAVFSGVGVADDVESEARAAAKFFDLSWNDLCEARREGEERGIIARRGRYAYVTPHVLAVWLAGRAWAEHGKRLLRLARDLPTSESRVRLLERLGDLGDDRIAREVVEALLAPDGLFPDVEALDDNVRAHAMGALSQASPEAGLRALERILGHLPRDRLVEFRRGRRETVWALERLAWPSEYFSRAAQLLLCLAEAENELCGNNATGIWVCLFQSHLGGTSAPAHDRLPVLERAFASESSSRRVLAVRGAASALSLRQTRAGGAEDQGGRIPSPEWRPTDWEEDAAYRRAAALLLMGGLRDVEPTVREAAVEAVQGTVPFLAGRLPDVALDLLRALPRRTEDERRMAREIVETTVYVTNDRLAPDWRTALEELNGSLLGPTYGERLRRWVGQRTHRDEYGDDLDAPGPAEAEVTHLALESLATPQALDPHMDWLSSAEAVNAGQFGYRLGANDARVALLGKLRVAAGQPEGGRLVGGYLAGQEAEGRGRGCWRRVGRWIREGLVPPMATLEICARAQPSSRRLETVLGLVTSGQLQPPALRRLWWSKWPEDLSLASFGRLLALLAADSEALSVAAGLEMLQRRLREHPGEHHALSGVALKLLRRFPGKVGLLGGYAWEAVAARYAQTDPVAVAQCALEACGVEPTAVHERDDRMQVLRACTEGAPKEVWEVVGGALLAGDFRACDLQMALRGWYADLVDLGTLLAWAAANLPEGPRALAGIAPMEGDPVPLLGEQLLVRYGDDAAVSDQLRDNLLSGTFVGSMVDWLEPRRRLVQAWSSHPSPSVNRWACETMDVIEEEAQRAALREEEFGL